LGDYNSQVIMSRVIVVFFAPQELCVFFVVILEGVVKIVEYPYDKWYKAIQVRQSWRQYDGRAVDTDLLLDLSRFLESLNNVYNGVRVILVQESPEDVFKGVIGSYGKIAGAPCYAAFIGNMDDPNVQEKTGYVGELFVLEAASKGLGTCWIAGFFRPETVKKHIELESNEKILSVTPVGYVSKELKSWDKRLMSFLARSRKRKLLVELYNGLEQRKWPQWVKEALECARMAPSAVNRQPWRFYIETNAIAVSVGSTLLEGGVSKRLDCGIAMSHIEIGAGAQGRTGSWEYLASPEVARFKVNS